LFGAVILT